MDLDDETLAAILSGSGPYLEQSCDGARWLNLGGFSHANDDVLESLAASIQNFEGIELGLRQLSPGIATALQRMNIGILALTGLHFLDEQAAFVLGSWSFDTRPIRHLRLRVPVSAQAAAWLVGEPPPEGACDRPLTVSVPSITLPVAQALSRHTHELYLEVREQVLSPDVAAVLCSHTGYSLTLDSDCGFSDEMLRALSSNHRKRIRKLSQRNRVYVVDHDMWCSYYESD